MLPSEPPSIPSTSDPNVPRKPSLRRDFDPVTANATELQDSRVDHQSRTASQEPGGRSGTIGTHRPFPAVREIPAHPSGNESHSGNLPEEQPRAQLNPLIPYNMGRFAGPSG